MTSVEQHYNQLLAEHYTWMLGDDIEQAARGQRALLDELGIRPVGHAADSIAVDLGCGSGAQTLALADLGFASVLGVDSSAALLDELAEHASGRPAVRTVHGDGLDALAELAEGSVDVVACMGDTVVHLPDREAVTRLAAASAAALRPGGAVVLTYRDLTQALEGVDRLIPVRSTPDQIMLCFLDYVSTDTVMVHDVIYTRADDGWDVHKSSYPKLRLDPSWLADQLRAAGLHVDHHALGPNRMWVTVARRAQPPARTPASDPGYYERWPEQPVDAASAGTLFQRFGLPAKLLE